jgi:hypothetical protein
VSERHIQYYDLKRHWTRRIEPHLGDPLLNRLMGRAFRKFARGMWGRQFKPGMAPCDVESRDWRAHRREGRRGRLPRFWRYVCTGACHWLANFELRLAQLAEPGRPWRIIRSRKHSTVWDGDGLLFDFNYYAWGTPAQDCFDSAFQGGEVYEVGEWTENGEPEPA